MNNQVFQVQRYFRYLITSKTRYNIHSPFVFDLIQKVFRDTHQYSDYQSLEVVKAQLLKRTSMIETVDFGTGAGKKKYATKVFPLGKLVKLRSQRKTQLELLYRLTQHFKPKTLLEFGTAAGISGSYLKMGYPSSKMVTMEGCAGLAEVAESVFEELKMTDINVCVGNFDVILPSALSKFKQLDFVFFDGNHRKEPTLNYFNQCLSLVHEFSVFIFDDIHWSPGMEEAWEEIKKHKSVTLTLDLFWFGIVFFKKGIEKQDFIIRY